MDYDLVAKLADANPQGSVVIIGPMTKVDPSAIPQRPNLHWLGGRDYSLLPAYVKKFDVCLMPFAINEATEYINPTKALEYMATGRPIVSTPVEDVVLQFSGVVKISQNDDEFVRLCTEAAANPDAACIKRGRDLAAGGAGVGAVALEEEHIADAIATKLPVAESGVA